MYPFFRLAKEMNKHRKSERLTLGETHYSKHICWPWDLDLWNELNNGRTLTLYDLGRVPMLSRLGMRVINKQNDWGLAVAGNSLRYRKRIKVFDVIDMRSTLIGWDNRFFYVLQSMWHGDVCANQGLYRIAAAGAEGIVPPERIAGSLGWGETSPTLPDWVQAWSAAENQRPWPPEL